MNLEVRPAEHADVTQCVAIRVASLGSLVIGRPQPYPGYVEDSESAMHNDLDEKPYVYHLKVVDPEHHTEVLAYAKWELYTQGRPDLEELNQALNEPDNEEPTKDEFGKPRRAAKQYFCSRNGEMGRFPHLLLALLVTSEEHRRRGAASLLLQWGIRLSETAGLPMYLQASAQGRQFYSYYRFEETGRVEFDLSEYGLEGVEVMSEMIRHLEEK